MGEGERITEFKIIHIDLSNGPDGTIIFDPRIIPEIKDLREEEESK